MNRYSDIDPQDIDPETGAPYAGFSSPSLDTSFHDGEIDVSDDIILAGLDGVARIDEPGTYEIVWLLERGTMGLRKTS